MKIAQESQELQKQIETLVHEFQKKHNVKVEVIAKPIYFDSKRAINPINSVVGSQVKVLLDFSNMEVKE